MIFWDSFGVNFLQRDCLFFLALIFECEIKNDIALLKQLKWIREFLLLGFNEAFCQLMIKENGDIVE